MSLAKLSGWVADVTNMTASGPISSTICWGLAKRGFTGSMMPAFWRKESAKVLFARSINKEIWGNVASLEADSLVVVKIGDDIVVLVNLLSTKEMLWLR